MARLSDALRLGPGVFLYLSLFRLCFLAGPFRFLASALACSSPLFLLLSFCLFLFSCFRYAVWARWHVHSLPHTPFFGWPVTLTQSAPAQRSFQPYWYFFHTRLVPLSFLGTLACPFTHTLTPLADGDLGDSANLMGALARSLSFSGSFLCWLVSLSWMCRLACTHRSFDDSVVAWFLDMGTLACLSTLLLVFLSSSAPFRLVLVCIFHGLQSWCFVLGLVGKPAVFSASV